MRIVTWNVNSVRQRLEHLLAFLKEAEPDVVCLQELKTAEATFPREEIEAAGYNLAIHGQKGFNGVAILSKHPMEDIRRGLPGNDEDEQSRYVEAVISTQTGIVRVASIYLPNGNPIDTPKFPYKLAWMDRLPRSLGQRRPVPAGDPREMARTRIARLHRRAARLRRIRGPLHLLGLPGRRLATKPRHPHRPPPPLPPGRRQDQGRGDLQARAQLGEAVGPCAGGGGFGIVSSAEFKKQVLTSIYLP
jgi:hypothetical protein